MELNERRIAILGIALAGMFTVASSSAHFDLFDTIVGIILVLMLGFVFSNTNSDSKELVLFSAISGLAYLLVFGILIDRFFSYIGLEWPSIYKQIDAVIMPRNWEEHAKHNYCITIHLHHFVAWLLFSVISYAYYKRKA